MATETKTRPVRFRSKHHNLRLLRVQADSIPDPFGGKGKELPGLRYEFRDFKLVVDDALIERDRQYFRDRATLMGREEPVEGVDYEPTLGWFRSHPEIDQSFIEIPLSEMAPPPNDAIKQITRLTAELKRDELQAFLDEERETYKREVVIESCEEALAQVDAITAPAENTG